MSMHALSHCSRAILILSLVAAILPHGADAQSVLIQAIQEGDAARVTRLLDQGQGVNDRTLTELGPITPLAVAVEEGNEGIARLLLDRGADPDLGLEDWDQDGKAVSPLELALSGRHQGIAALLLTRGATVTEAVLAAAQTRGTIAQYVDRADERVVRSFYRARLDRALLRGDHRQAEAVAREAAGRIDLEPATDLLYAYTFGAAELRDVVDRIGPREISSGSYNLLDRLLTPGARIQVPAVEAGSGLPRSLPLPLATTYRTDMQNAGAYAPGRAVDGDPATAWAEGVAGTGVGQKLAVPVAGYPVAVSVVTGLGDARQYSRHNRVRDARLSLYVLRSEGGYTAERVWETTARLEDTVVAQRVNLPATAAPALGGQDRLMLVLEILSVYTGSAGEDTCVSEIVSLDLSNHPVASADRR